MRLYDRMFLSGFATVNPDNPPGYVGDALKAAVRIDITNVAEYLSSFPDGKEWDPQDAPSLMFPFSTAWLEWHEAGDQGAFLARQVLETGDVVIQWLDLFMGAKMLDEISGGRPLHIGALEVAVYRSDGRVRDVSVVLPNHLINDEAWVRTIWTKFPVVMLAISFMHCKNVTVGDAPPPGIRQQRRREQRDGVRHAQFKTLVIDPMKRVLATEGQAGIHGIKRALHICRGHFKTYTADKPRFGRDIGTFWYSPHVRGSEDVGVIGKEYAVRAPKEAS